LIGFWALISINSVDSFGGSCGVSAFVTDMILVHNKSITTPCLSVGAIA
jgi:hypothetical protein